MEKLQTWMTEFPAVVAIALNVVIALLILIIGWWLSAVAGRAIKRMAARSARVDPTIVPMAQSVTVWTIRVFVPRRLHDQRSTSPREIGRSPFHKASFLTTRKN